mgnify:CR=1 FL=1
MAMDVGTNSNAEPNPEVNAVEGTPNQEDKVENNQGSNGTIVNKSVDDFQENTTTLESVKEQNPNLELAAQLEEIAAVSRRNASTPSGSIKSTPELVSEAEGAQPSYYRGVKYAPEKQRYAPEKLTVSGGGLLQWFYNLPVSSKQ